ncbi:helix-turn-helix transcriptional regulator [Alkalimonas collagenimarina]|uniref:Helix-turn-helix transcriptional regulator n=1 Tax=Alkalimonas collagenimarina TaxID=400390 RepID=A0ABT9H024_9GAMM|nr:helix-turn-helix transcriptional regulator [Alkalimonas collagenimarina]MDP4536657.1 helix-turn-helix transcriptional regulator [Alkalimonas collagenimarina]
MQHSDETLNLAGWSQALLSCQQACGKTRFYTELGQLLQQLLPADEYLVLMFDPKRPPELLHQRHPLQSDDFDRYLKSAYVLDPFYRKGLQQGQQGVFRLRDIVPADFHDYDQYYNSYFRHLKIADEVGYLIPLPAERRFVHIELARFAGRELFPTAELQQASQLFDVIASLVIQHQQQLPLHEGSGCIEHDYIEAFYRRFGSEVCTPREHEVLCYMLQGYCVKTIAHQMQLGLETIKMHRKNLYAKLNIGSHPELLALFIDLLTVTEPPVRSDPLLQNPRLQYNSALPEAS